MANVYTNVITKLKTVKANSALALASFLEGQDSLSAISAAKSAYSDYKQYQEALVLVPENTVTTEANEHWGTVTALLNPDVLQVEKDISALISFSVLYKFTLNS